MADDPDLDAILESALDDLGDEDEMAAGTPIQTQQAPQVPSAPSTPMGAFVSQGGSPATPPSPVQDVSADLKEMLESLSGGDPNLNELFETLAKQMEGVDGGAPTNTEDSKAEAPEGRADVDELTQTFQKALDGLKSKASELDGLSPDALGGKDGEEFLKGMLENFENDPQLSGAMEAMMSALMSRDVLYEPLKDMNNKFPKWLEDNEGKVSQEDFTRYRRQFEYVREICAVYEANVDGTDQKVMALMTQMTELGQPPQDLLGELGDGQAPPNFPGFGGPGGQPNCSVM